MTTEQLLMLEGIRQSPKDTLRRLVLADSIQESGDELRAEFIRLQCAIMDSKYCKPVLLHSMHASQDGWYYFSWWNKKAQRREVAPHGMEYTDYDEFEVGQSYYVHCGSIVTNHLDMHHGLILNKKYPRNSDGDERGTILLFRRSTFPTGQDEFKSLLSAQGILMNTNANWRSLCYRTHFEAGWPAITGPVNPTVKASPVLHNGRYPTVVVSGIRQTMKGGFIDEVACTMRQWQLHGAKLVKYNPITSVDIIDKIPLGSASNRRYTWTVIKNTGFDATNHMTYILPEPLIDQNFQHVPTCQIECYSERHAKSLLSEFCIAWALRERGPIQ